MKLIAGRVPNGYVVMYGGGFRYGIRMAGTMNIELQTGNDPEKIVEVTAKKCGFNETEKKGFLANLLRDRESTERFTLFDTVNAVTRLAQDAENYDRAVELERLGGGIIDLKKSDFSRN